MKLIKCKNCNDVVRLVHTTWRKCDCGKSGGQYNDDLISATVGGDCEVIGIRNDFFTTSKKNRVKDDLNLLIQGEYLGDVQIHRIVSSNGPKLKMDIEEIDKETNKITFTDHRKYTINLKGDKSPKTLEIPSNKKPSFKDNIDENTTKDFLKKRVQECMVMELLQTMVDEDYPTTFDMNHFKKLRRFAERIRYCESNLQRISSGSSRIVYKIDNEKVLKLAKNEKGLAQNEIESGYSKYQDLSDVVARTFDYNQDNTWVEMELARKVSKGDFKRITGFSFEDYSAAVNNYGLDVHPRQYAHKADVDKNVVAAMWEDEFVYGIFDYIGNYDIPVGDLMRLSSYGIVKRGGKDTIVLIDFGMTQGVSTSYYA